MEDWKERLKAEYAQTKERYEKLKAYNNKLSIDARLGRGFGDSKTHPSHEECRKQDVREQLLKQQQTVMGEYLNVLELRAELEEIEL